MLPDFLQPLLSEIGVAELKLSSKILVVFLVLLLDQRSEQRADLQPTKQAKSQREAVTMAQRMYAAQDRPRTGSAP
jgi:hypothetical protein